VQQRLRQKVHPFLLRRLKRDVAKELPERTDMVLRCTLSEDERNFYESVRNIGKADIQKLLEGGRMLHVLELLLRMRQAACSAALVSKSWEKGSSKLELLLETLDEVLAEGHAALVFSQWTSLLDQVEPLLTERGIRYCRLDGSTRDRAAVVAQFSAEDGPPVFLLSLKAGGTGLNLTRADYVFHLDPWWNPAAEDQATDRAHRIGQLRPVFSCKLIAEDTVEERILELQSRKRDLVKAALDDDALARSLTRDELLALFD
jgi:SNF2 family DNA or RNA helicase